MLSNRIRQGLATLLLLLTCGGCGPVLYISELGNAEEQFERAVDANARWYAPYEYYFALANLEKAREEAASAAYEDAVRFARTAEGYSTRALEITRRKRAERP